MTWVVSRSGGATESKRHTVFISWLKLRVLIQFCWLARFCVLSSSSCPKRCNLCSLPGLLPLETHALVCVWMYVIIQTHVHTHTHKGRERTENGDLEDVFIATNYQIKHCLSLLNNLPSSLWEDSHSPSSAPVFSLGTLLAALCFWLV